MDLLWPGFLLLLVLIPTMIAVYLWALRRRRFAVRYSSLSLLRDAIPQDARVRRHLPFGMFLFGLGSLVFALGRPVAIVSIPTDQTVILLSIDVSRSMCSTDVSPSRIEAAQAAALSFIQQQKPGTRIGIGAFSSFAEIVQAPTTDQDALRAAIEGLATGRRTAIGSGILKAIDAIAEVDQLITPSVSDSTQGSDVVPVPKGAYAPDIIVVLTDGASNTGPQPVEAAQQAADRGLRVYTIGFGTAKGAEFPRCPQRFLGNEPFGGGPGGGQFGGGQGGGQFGGGGGFGGNPFRRGIDEETLKKVAALTGAEYYSAESAGELQKVFMSLPTNLIMKHDVTEISVFFTAIGAIFAALAVVTALRWNPLP